jgi:hypothetical protein
VACTGAGDTVDAVPFTVTSGIGRFTAVSCRLNDVGVAFCDKDGGGGGEGDGGGMLAFSSWPWRFVSFAR